jgi:hypothetical protein
MRDDKVFIIKIKPDGENSFAFCQEKGLIGIGWKLDNGIPKTLDDYERLRGEENRKFSNEASLSRALNVFKELENGGLIWTISPDKEYYLCKTDGKYSYHGDKDEYIEADVINCLDCVFYKIGASTIVPSKIIDMMRLPGTAKSTDDDIAVKTTFDIYNLICRKINNSAI